VLRGVAFRNISSMQWAAMQAIKINLKFVLAL